MRHVVGDDDLPYLSLEAFFDKALSVGDVFVCGFFFPKTYIEGRAMLFFFPIVRHGTISNISGSAKEIVGNHGLDVSIST